MRKLHLIALVLAAALGGPPVAVSPALAGDAAVAVGQPAPAFTLPVATSRSIQLSDYRGKWLVLYFYPKDMTSGCTIEAQRFQRDLEKYHGLNAEIVGVSADALDSHAMFSKKEGLTFTLASDVGGKVARAYGSWYGMGDYGVAARNTYLIDPQGRVARVFNGVNPTTHSEEVLDALRSLQAKASR